MEMPSGSQDCAAGASTNRRISAKSSALTSSGTVAVRDARQVQVQHYKDSGGESISGRGTARGVGAHRDRVA